jgi:molybdenum cofactor guanylyltransferase
MSATLRLQGVTDIAGVILAGGLGRRMGGTDKGLRPLRGRPMVTWVLERFALQVDEVIINANQHIEVYSTFGYPVIPDRIGGFVGPLAGLHAALSSTALPWVASVPCDSPRLPLDLVERLHAAAIEGRADLAVARTADQPHPVFCVCRHTVLDHLTAFLAGGGRKVDQWYASLPTVEVNFDDQVEAFSNINTPEELAQFEA